MAKIQFLYRYNVANKNDNNSDNDNNNNNSDNNNDNNNNINDKDNFNENGKWFGRLIVNIYIYECLALLHRW